MLCERLPSAVRSGGQAARSGQPVLWQQYPRHCTCLHTWPTEQSVAGNRVRRHTERLPRLCARRRDPLVAPFIVTGMDQEGEMQGVDLMGYLLRNRIIFIGGRINDEVATKVVASMMALQTLDPSADIKLYINSQGGQAYSVMAILDAIDAVKPDICTIAFGLCASTATLLLAAGKKGKRFSMPSTRIMMHQPAGGAMGSADEVNIQASELNRTMKVMHRFYQRFTGLELQRVEEECDRDNFMSPARAIELGLIDGVVADPPGVADKQLHAAVA